MGTHPIFESDFDCLTEMANRSQAVFLNQMLRLRSRIQNRLPHELMEQAGPIETHMAKQPRLYDERFTTHMNHPFNQQSREMLKEIREMGLYIDEHRDFNEMMYQIREETDRGKPYKLYSKKKWKNEDITWSKDPNWKKMTNK